MSKVIKSRRSIGQSTNICIYYMYKFIMMRKSGSSYGNISSRVRFPPFIQLDGHWLCGNGWSPKKIHANHHFPYEKILLLAQPLSLMLIFHFYPCIPSCIPILYPWKNHGILMYFIVFMVKYRHRTFKSSYFFSRCWCLNQEKNPILTLHVLWFNPHSWWLNH